MPHLKLVGTVTEATEPPTPLPFPAAVPDPLLDPVNAVESAIGLVQRGIDRLNELADEEMRPLPFRMPLSGGDDDDPPRAA